MLSPDLPVHGIIKFGYWQEPDLDADEIKSVLARFAAALSAAERDPALADRNERHRPD